MTAHVTIAEADGGREIEVVDAIERHRFVLELPAAATPEPVATDRLGVPIDAAVSVRTDRLTVPTVVPVYVRDGAGRMVAEVEHGASESVPDGRYLLEVCGPVKLYLRVDGPLAVETGVEEMTVDLARESRVLLGARSYHDRPAATVTVSPDPADVMAAVSTFGSALKTTSPERSFPTLRGHPPTVEVGEALDVPAGLDAPDTGVRIECPRDLSSVFAVASLAYYLGASVVPEPSARIVTDAGFERPLSGPGVEFETVVERTLQQVFLLDCLVRTGGFYEVTLHEREALEARLAGLGLDLDDCYGLPPAERLARYLDVPFEAVADALPAWNLTTYLDPTPAGIAVLPHLVDDLSLVRRPRQRRLDDSEMGRVVADTLRFDAATRSAAKSTLSVDSFVQPPAGESLEQAWVGDGVPVGASKLTLQACRNRLDRSPATGDISVTVVCTDPAMAEEGAAVEGVYGSRPDRPFDVDVHLDPTADRLRDLLGRDAEFLHFVGHIDDGGVVCDGDDRVPVRSLDRVGVDCFLLNGCRSYEQGLGLVEAGAVGGIVTVSDVIDASAVELGGTVARLLNRGFPIRSALEIARSHDIHGANYVTVGDGGVAIAQAESGTPCVYEIRRDDGDGFLVDIVAYPPKEGGMGSMYFPYLADNETHYLASGSIGTFAVDGADLRRFLALEDAPVRVGDDLRWSSDLPVEEL